MVTHSLIQPFPEKDRFNEGRVRLLMGVTKKS